MNSIKQIPDRKRIEELFLSLCCCDSLSFAEDEMAARLKSELEQLGFEVKEDDAGVNYGSKCGNLYGFLKGRTGQEPVLFSAHMDTVEPGLCKQPKIRDGRITSDGKTVLGADDVSGIVEILEGIRIARNDPSGHGDIEVLFTIGEEAYAKGAAVFDYGKIKSVDAYVLDMSGAPGEAAGCAPSIISFEVKIMGRPAHAGFEPEKGVNALLACARAIAGTRQGHISDKTTVNIGTIMAGTADNIVAANCICSGEVRSFDHGEALESVNEIKKTFTREAEAIGAMVEFTKTVHLEAYEIPRDSRACLCFQEACKELGLEGKIIKTHGGSDNNVFVRRGLSGLVLSCGMYNVHSTEEYTYVEDLVKGAELVAAIIRKRPGKAK